GLRQDMEQETWAPMQNFGIERMVNRVPGCVEQVIINGKLAVEDQQVVAALGQERGFGTFLPAR
ncbi:MAG: N-acyl-D-glutamate amidohydrolase, partial [Pseudomonas sp.]|nr:N-acyl-D-glutamate amidohydrolase [Pseudomonas sp.]